MKKIITSAATATAGIPFEANNGSGPAGIDFVQENIIELADALAKMKILDTTKANILWGCVRVDSSGTTTISEGYVWYNLGGSFGELFHVPDASFPTPAGGQYINASYNNLFSAADPTLLTDNVTTANVHALRDIAFTTSVTPSAGTLPDFTAWIIAGKPVYTDLTSGFVDGWAARTGLWMWLDNNGSLHIFGTADGAAASGANVCQFTLPAGFPGMKSGGASGFYFPVVDLTDGTLWIGFYGSLFGVPTLGIETGYVTGKIIDFGHIVIPPN